MGAAVEISAREAEVLTMLGEHLSNAEIGARLFISVRTVESHVSSLLRKLEVPDRRALAQRAGAPAGHDARPRPVRAPSPPAPLTSFVGRARERRELAELLGAHRQVTAVGPGGVGKTRLALALAADAGAGAPTAPAAPAVPAVSAAPAASAVDDWPDGVWFVDLVPVTDASALAVAAAIATALGLGEQPGRGLDDSVIADLADRRALLVLDNCEHLRDALASFLERLLAACPRITVLATSRAPLLVPFERVYRVPPLSLAGGGESEAVALFLERASAAGALPEPASWEGIAALCERLDGVALAIELAAARWPALGLDGLAAGLADQLRLLAGGSRADDRHRSVRAALDWSHNLLAPDDQALLRRISVFVTPFTVQEAATVTGSAPGPVADGLARLVEQSLLTVTMSPSGTEYRALETIRQYGGERLAAAGELLAARDRHLRWCLSAADALSIRHTVPGDPGDPGLPEWRAGFDRVADDLRAAFSCSADRPELRPEAYRLARRLAELTFARNLIGESQLRHEQAAGLADDPAEAASLLRQAASVAGCRTRGEDMHRLRLAAADAALRSGDPVAAACELATAAAHAYRFSFHFDRAVPRQEVLDLLTRARELGGDAAPAVAAVALAEAGVLGDAFGSVQGPAAIDVPDTLARAARAVELAARTDDPLAESAALDALLGAQSWAGDALGAAATARRRVVLLSPASPSPASLSPAFPSPLSPSPALTHELVDALATAVEASLGAGDLRTARECAGRLADHPLLAELGHRATSWLLLTDALLGEVEEVRTVGARCLEAWRRSGCPDGLLHLDQAMTGVAMVHALRGDEAAHREWLGALDRLGASPRRTHGHGAVFDALLLLHRGQPAEAAARLSAGPAEPAERWRWIFWIWHHWYVALRVEAAVLAGAPDAATLLTEARVTVAGNPVAEALVARAEAILTGDPERLLATAQAFDAAGCRYQAARTLVLAGGDHALRGAAAFAALGLAPTTPSPSPGLPPLRATPSRPAPTPAGPSRPQ